VDYSAAKAGIIGFTFALAKEVTQHGIYVNSISPGPIGTEKILNRTPTERSFKLMELTGMGRRGEPEEVAAMALFLVSDEASFITGQNYPVCGLRNLGGA
jgi:NAD(P)-dependent dehydrogenase (short-subunit alcohol dehydrogenase family)